MRPACILLLAVAAAGCSRRSDAPWLTAVDLAAHAAFLPLAGTVHDPTVASTGVSCDACHPGTTFKQFDCTTCHTQAQADPLHAGVAGYQWASASCYGCHPTGTGTMADHGSFFPIGTGSSHALGCTQCHTDSARRTDPSTLACASCHAAIAGFSTAHAAVADYDATSPGCVRCHGDAQVDRVAAHTQFPVARGSATHDTVCLQCHTALRTDKPFAADLSTFDCLGCHAQPATDTAHQSVTGYAYASASCYGCHPSGAAAPADHDASFFPIGTGTQHAGIACTQCHTDLASPTVATHFACGTCHLALDATLVARHTTSTSNTRVTVSAAEISTSDSSTCLRCHADAQVTLTSAHPSGTEGDPPHQRATCLQCHDVFRSDKTFGADFASDPALASKLGPKEGCYHCHDSAPPRGD
jgi:hypothetical protein